MSVRLSFLQVKHFWMGVEVSLRSVMQQKTLLSFHIMLTLRVFFVPCRYATDQYIVSALLHHPGALKCNLSICLSALRSQSSGSNTLTQTV